MKVPAGTTYQKKKKNCSVANDILENPEVQRLMGVYKVDGHGIVTLSTQKGKGSIGQKLCHERKPSHYKGPETHQAKKVSCQSNFTYHTCMLQ